MAYWITATSTTSTGNIFDTVDYFSGLNNKYYGVSTKQQDTSNYVTKKDFEELKYHIDVLYDEIDKLKLALNEKV